MESEGLQSDARYAQSYVFSRTRRGFGPLHIKLELQKRGVSAGLVETCIDFKDQAWTQVAIREYKKKFGAQPTAMSIKERAKRVRYLQSRGFTGDIIKVTLAKISDAETTSDAEG